MKSSHQYLGFAAGAALALGAGSQAMAQDMFARDGAVAVKERPHPEYEALGGRLGSFLIFPKVQGDVAYDSNVFAVATDETSDVIWTLQPSVEAQSDWNRHSVSGFARGRVTRYTDSDSEDRNTFNLGGQGRYDIQQGRFLNLRGDFRRDFESRTASQTPTSVSEPIQFDIYSATLSADWLLNRVKLNGSVGVQTSEFQNGVTNAGEIVRQDTRNQTTTSLSARADYALSPATALFVSITGNQREFDVADALTPLRNSEGVNILTGVDFEVSDLIRADIGVGYIGQSYDDPLYGEFSGFSARGNINYFVTELVTLGLSGSREVFDSGIAGSAGILSTQVEATADYEFRRNVILEARLGARFDEFDTTDRQNDIYNVGVRGTYLLNRSVGVTGGYAFDMRRSSGVNAINDYDAHRFTLSLVLQY